MSSAAAQKALAAAPAPSPTFFPGDTRLHALVSYSYTSDGELRSHLAALAAKGRDVLATAVDARNSAGQTPLHLACQSSYVKGVEMLLRHGANAHAANDRGLRPAHVVAGLPEHSGTLLVLLASALTFAGEAGGGFSARDSAGNTPLHVAAAVGGLEAVVLLLELGSAPDARSHSGDSPPPPRLAAANTRLPAMQIIAPMAILPRSFGSAPLRACQRQRPKSTGTKMMLARESTELYQAVGMLKPSRRGSTCRSIQIRPMLAP